MFSFSLREDDILFARQLFFMVVARFLINAAPAQGRIPGRPLLPRGGRCWNNNNANSRKVQGELWSICIC